MQKTDDNRNIRRRWLRAALGIVLLVTIVGSTFIYESAVPSPPSPLPDKQSVQSEINHDDGSDISFSLADPSMNRPLAFLIVGIDERKDDGGRTDTIIVFTARPRDRSVKIVSIPRDTKTVLADVPLHPYDKINHAYALGKGLSSTKRTVEQFLGIPIDYTVSINMKGFKQLVDVFGGVDVRVPRDFTAYGYHFTKGPMTLNGAQALAYVRERTGTNDFDRNKRQQQVLRSLMSKASRLSTIAKIAHMLHIIDNNVETNLTPWQLFQLQRLYGHLSGKNIEYLKLSGTDEWSDAYYFIVDEASREKVREKLRAHLSQH